MMRGCDNMIRCGCDISILLHLHGLARGEVSVAQHELLYLLKLKNTDAYTNGSRWHGHVCRLTMKVRLCVMQLQTMFCHDNSLLISFLTDLMHAKDTPGVLAVLAGLFAEARGDSSVSQR